MYATAQRVRKTKGGEGAINAFLYIHSPGDLAMTEAGPDIEKITSANTGRLALRIENLPSGGNEVLSYLDVATDEKTPNELIVAALTKLAQSLPRSLPAASVLGGVAVRFGAVLGTRWQHEEYGHLRDGILIMLRAMAPATPSEPRPEPFLIRTTVDEEGTTYALDEGSSRRVQALHLGMFACARLGVTHESKSDFQRLVGDLHAEVAQALTGLSLDQIETLGGLRIVKDATEEEIWSTRAGLATLRADDP